MAIVTGIYLIKRKNAELICGNHYLLGPRKKSNEPSVVANDDIDGEEVATPILSENNDNVCSEPIDNINLSRAIQSRIAIERFRKRATSRVHASLKIQLQKILETSKRDVDRGRFTVGKQIGSGNFGKVYKGTIDGLFDENSKSTVAIKTISNKMNETELENIICEIKIMSSVDPHLNLVSMVASCSSQFRTDGKLWLLLEFCKHGDLKMYLMENRAKLSVGGSNGDLNHRNLITWAYDIASGMEYLTRKEIMHGDLAARNILMDENPLNGGRPVAKIADFGLSKMFSESLIYEKESRLFVPWRWMALEYLTEGYFTLKSDVWSFGILFWEILSLGKVPYGHQCYDEVLEQLKNGYRIPFPVDLEYMNVWSPIGLFKKLSDGCFVAEPNNRSSFSDVIEMIGNELTRDELMQYQSMNDMYLSTRTENYRKLENPKICTN